MDLSQLNMLVRFAWGIYPTSKKRVSLAFRKLLAWPLGYSFTSGVFTIVLLGHYLHSLVWKHIVEEATSRGFGTVAYQRFYSNYGVLYKKSYSAILGTLGIRAPFVIILTLAAWWLVVRLILRYYKVPSHMPRRLVDIETFGIHSLSLFVATGIVALLIGVQLEVALCLRLTPPEFVPQVSRAVLYGIQGMGGEFVLALIIAERGLRRYRREFLDLWPEFRQCGVSGSLWLVGLGSPPLVRGLAFCIFQVIVIPYLLIVNQPYLGNFALEGEVIAHLFVSISIAIACAFGVVSAVALTPFSPVPSRTFLPIILAFLAPGWLVLVGEESRWYAVIAEIASWPLRGYLVLRIWRRAAKEFEEGDVR